jgi:hypothetical protein
VPNDMPVYLSGDTITFMMELEHDFNLGDAWAVFLRRVKEGEAETRFTLTLNLVEMEEVRRDGTKITSALVFSATLTRTNSLPGEYDLETIRALPFGIERTQGAQGAKIEAPEGVAFRIVSLPMEPSTEIRRWALGKRNEGRRYLRD